MQLRLAFGRDQAGVGGEALSGDPNLHFWACPQILYPVGGRVFGDHIEAPVAIGEPDLDFARQTTAAAASGEIKVLLAVIVL